MFKENELVNRLKKFSLRIYNLSASLPNTISGRYLHQQLLRAGMSSYANYRAAQHGQSKASFISKLSIALEEADECYLWLDIIIETKTLPEEKVSPLRQEALELSNILAACRKTARTNTKKP
jgi:four helix bundle protein